MKIYIKLLIIASLLFIDGNSFSLNNRFSWGTKIDQVKKTLDDNTLTFDLKNSRYKNKILDFFLSIDRSIEKDIIIVRKKGYPTTDYTFLKNKLYAVTYNYGTQPRAKGRGILKKLKSKYKLESKKRDRNLFIYAFNDSKSNIYFYVTLKGSKAQCTLYLHSKRLFRIVMMGY